MITESARDVMVALAAGSVPALLGYFTSRLRVRAQAKGQAQRTTREEFQILYEEARAQLEDARRTISDLRTQITDLQLRADMAVQREEEWEERERLLERRLQKCEEDLEKEQRARAHSDWVVDQIRQGNNPDDVDKRRNPRR